MERSNKLKRRHLFGYAFGAIPTGLFAFIFSLKYIEFFYNDLKLIPIYFIIGQVIYMAVNSLNDPLLGQLSDRTDRAKWGSRRLIYIKYGGPIWALTFLLVWFPWSLDNQIIIFIHYTISICLFDTMLTLVVLVWLAILPEMTEDIDERNKAHLFSIILGFFAVIPFFLIIGDMDPLSQQFKVLMIIIAIISTVFLFLTASMCEERREFQKDETFSLKTSLKEAFKSKAFTIYVGFYFCMNLLGSLGLSYLFVYLLLLERITPGSLLLYFLIYIVVGFGAQAVCAKLRPRWGMRKTILVFGSLRAVGGIVLFFLLLIPTLEPLIWLGLIWLTFFGGYAVFHIPMQYLAIDEDEVKTGTRREGMFIGIMALLTKPATSLGPIFATLVLTSFGYIQGSSNQPAQVFIGIKILMILIPSIVAAISLIFIYYYPLHGDRLNEMQAKLANLHKDKLSKIE